MNRQIDLQDLTDEQLVKEEKKRKTSYLTYNVLLGIMIGVAIYSTVKKGLGFFTFFPLFFTPMAFLNRRSYMDVKKEINSRQNR